MMGTNRSGVAGLLVWMAGITSLAIVLLPPLGYFLIEHEALADSLEIESRMQAVIVSRIVGRNPRVWRFESERLNEGLHELRDPARLIRIFDAEGHVLTELGDLVAPPEIAGEAEFFEYGVAVGRIRTAASLLPALKGTGLIFLVTGVLGFVVFVPLRRIPLLALDRANEALSSSNREYRTLVEGLTEGMILTDEAGVVVAANPSAARILGLSRELLVGRSMTQILSSTVREDGSRFDPDAWFTGSVGSEPARVERLGLRFADGGGKIVWVFVRSQLASDHGKQPVRIAISFEDITHRKRLEEIILLNAELEQRVHERSGKLEEAIRELETFSYSISHDLRSPLRSVMGFSQVLETKYGDQLDATAKEYLDRMRDEARKMLKLIDNLLSLAQVSRHEPQLGQVDLSGVAWQIVERLCATEPAREVTMNIQAGLRARCDPGMVRSALEELLGNAWKFTTKTPTPCIEFGVHRENGEDVYFVRDNGAGFDRAFAGKLFVPFQRLHAQGEFEGAGIGLAKVRRIIERHGGRVWSEGHVGAGATFYFTLHPAALISAS